jgi:hypothetical protein
MSWNHGIVYGYILNPLEAKYCLCGSFVARRVEGIVNLWYCEEQICGFLFQLTLSAEFRVVTYLA